MALAEILAHKREEIAQRKRSRPLDTFERSITRSDRSLRDALAEESTGFILECKRSSPSLGRIRSDFDLESIAGSYAPFASAVSVLTDERYFEGELAFVQRVRDVVDVPVVLKDFVVDRYQVFEARAHGADAVLLMLSVLDDQQCRSALEAATSLGMDAIVEVHDEEELKRAIAIEAPIIGINNRNLIDLTIDLDTTQRLAPRVPDNRLVICESGIRSHHDVLSVRHQVDAFLVGSSLMRQENLDVACRELIFGPVKVCGVTDPADAQCAWRHGATYGGLIFADESPRCVTMDRAREVRSTAPLNWVGVFVNETIVTVAERAAELDLFAVQLHGDEGADYMAELRTVLPSSCAVWKAQRVGDASSVDASGSQTADRLLLDTYSRNERGGTGRRFDWGRIDDYGPRDRIVLSGGLAPDNIASADRERCAALDVNSGVESSAGRKDAAKVEQLFHELRGYCERGKR